MNLRRAIAALVLHAPVAALARYGVAESSSSDGGPIGTGALVVLGLVLAFFVVREVLKNASNASAERRATEERMARMREELCELRRRNERVWAALDPFIEGVATPEQLYMLVYPLSKLRKAEAAEAAIREQER